MKTQEISRHLLKYIYNNELIDQTMKQKMMLKQTCFKKSSKTALVNRCTLTGRNRGIFRKTKMSRLASKFYIAEGYLNGFKKASW